MIRNSRQYWLQVLAVGFVIATSIYVLTGEITSNLRNSLGIASDAQLLQRPFPGRGKSTADSAGNSTLGFDTIYFINMATRYDRLDAASLQAYLSGIDIKLSSGVSADMMHDVGMPPTHTPGLLGDGQKGCWRAHANVWSKMLRENTKAALIIEADASWDTNIRDIMLNFNKNFTEFLHRTNSESLPKPRLRDNFQKPHSGSLAANKDDPWHSDHWDILSIGQCSEETLNSEINMIYDDPHVPPGMDYYGRILGRERVIRKAGHQGCTTGYAVSLNGAAKLLLRFAADLDQAVDMGMSSLVQSGHITSYSVYPPILAQWVYVDGINMDQRGSNSDMGGTEGNSIGSESDPEATNWEEARKAGSVWEPKKWPSNAAFEEMALQSAWQQIFGGADPYTGLTTTYSW